MRGQNREIARVTVELASPLAIGSGAWDDLVDSPFALDASGLPTIPGTSLAGVLRAAWQRCQTKDIPSAQDVFGFQKRAQNGQADGKASCVEISFAAIHGADDRPVGPRLSAAEIAADPLLRLAQLPVVRPHVRLNHLGAADATERGLFDRSQVAAGHRFTFEIAVVDSKPEVLDRLLGLLAAGEVRLGGRGRSGLGELRLKRVLRRRFDLQKKNDFDDFCGLPVDLHEPVGDELLPTVPEEELQDLAGLVQPGRGAVTATLTVSPRGFWLVGGGRPADDPAGGKPPDILPYREPCVVWGRGEAGRETGSLRLDSPELVVPASALRGALRHRMAFHANRLANPGCWADDVKDPTKLRDHDGLRHVHVCALFGEAVAHGTGGNPDRGRPGRVWVDDVRPVPQDSTRIPHVALDRFTGGPIDGALFEEEALWRGAAWEVRIRIEPPPSGEAEAPPEARRALGQAIADLAAARLQIGSGSGRGNGWLEGKVEWSDGGKWASGKGVADEP
ncbi:MAG: RAMP superfamily CRISPR-associated protein [Acidobacteriota bacterium]|jgi:CRISPR/Cas system CSM-associated protein Csm3 (group 7 of RAMP superfamily)|nr:RAMP superfamily CRISPR-associated protein [Acidobacteriota bacterium]